MPLYDERCVDCDHTEERRRSAAADPLPCTACGGPCKVVWLTTPSIDRAKDPYDLLNGPIPSSRKIKSFANDRRKGGKDTVG